jgi:SulP family sulfate permease
VLIVCFSLTSSFYYLPKSVLGSIVFVAVSSLFDWHAFVVSWKVDTKDFMVMLLTFLCTICLGTEIGLAVGVGISMLTLLHGSAFPHTAVLGVVESAESGAKHWRNTTRFTMAKEPAAVLVFRIDASLQFINRSHVVSKLTDAMALKDFHESESSFHPGVVLDCTAINSIDMAGLEVLQELQQSLSAKGISLVAAGVKGPVRDVIDRENAYQTKAGGKLLLPWSKDLTGTLTHPICIMVPSIDEGLSSLLKKPTGDVESQ